MTVEEYNEKYDNPLLVCHVISEKKGKNISKAKKKNSKPAWNKGIKATKEQKEKQSKIMKEKYDSGELKHWNVGNKTSKDTRHKISKKLKGHNYFTEESVNKRNTTIQQKVDDGWVSPLKGKKISEEHKQKSVNQLRINNINKQNKFNKIIEDKCVDENLQIISTDGYYYQLKCLTCETEFERTRQVFRESKNAGKELCPTCYPPSFISKGETEFIDFIRSVYDGTIKTNDRNVLSGKEIDCYLPELNIGFEFCGVYWHSEIYHEKKHLVDKQQFGLKRGVKIYSIFDAEWNNQTDIVKSRVLSILGLVKNKIYARKTVVKQISAKESNQFLDENHLQGKDNAKIRYGALHDNKLVAVMTFTKGGHVKIKNGGYELNRFCVLVNTSVVGIASKLFKRFLNDYSPDKVTTYANSRWSYGELYKAIGFKFDKMSPPCAWYTNDFKTLKHRASFMRHKIKNVDDYDSTIDAIHDMGYTRVYDCGNTVWTYDVIS